MLRNNWPLGVSAGFQHEERFEESNESEPKFIEVSFLRFLAPFLFLAM